MRPVPLWLIREILLVIANKFENRSGAFPKYPGVAIPMREEPSTTHAKALFIKALDGQNFSPKSVLAYGDDRAQFTGWLQSIDTLQALIAQEGNYPVVYSSPAH